MFIFYGYDADRRVLYTIGYNKRAIFSKLEIPFDEFEKSIDYTEDKDGKHIALIKHNNDRDEKLNLYDVRFWLDQYLNSKTHMQQCVASTMSRQCPQKSDLWYKNIRLFNYVFVLYH